MADYILTLTSAALLAAVLLGTWHRLVGSPGSLLRSMGRLAVVIVISLTVVGASVYVLSKSRSVQLAGRLVSHVDTTEKVVALTLDDGPDPSHTQEVLDILGSHGVRATFYLTGAESAQYQSQVRKIASAGHEIGNHTYNHRRMYFLSRAEVAAEVERTDAVIRSAGYDGPISFRPPGCKRLLTAPLYLANTDRTSVTWDLEPDSIASIADDADAMTQYVVENARPGSIILMHVMYDSREASRKALPQILERLTAEGYRFATVAELQQLAERTP